VSEEAWIGRWTSRRFCQPLSSRSIEARPAWLEPLSTIQETARAEAKGSLVMTFSTSPPNSSIPVLGSTRSNRLAWWTSQAAR
jgi:hypothetical protein